MLPLLDLSGIGLFRCGLDGTLLWVNAAMASMLALRPEELLGRRVADLHADPLLLDDMLKRLLGGERLREHVSRLYARDGAIRHVSVDACPVTVEGRVAHSCWLVRDVTGRVLAERARDAAVAREQALRVKAEEANRLKDEFLATMSHELRTPLSAILGWVQLLQERTFDPRTLERGVETIERNARVQSKIVEDMLDVSRIITGKLSLRMRVVELNSVVEQAIEVVRPTADAKGVRFDVHMDSNVAAIRADPDRLQQIVWNLLVNAVRFTPRGGSVGTSVQRVGDTVIIEVKDTGRGIRPEFLPLIWERFRQADGTARRSGGLGLGLAIVRHLAEAHGGTAFATSPGEGLGATFRVTLPLPAIHTDSGEFESTRPDWPVPAVPGRELHGVKILVVEDDTDTRELLLLMLRDRGGEVTVAGSAEEALGHLSQRLPDVILSDLGMPNVDGYDLIRAVRSLPPDQGGRIPAIALTAYASAEDQRKALLAGFQVHVPKPVSVHDLVAVVANASAPRIGSVR